MELIYYEVDRIKFCKLCQMQLKRTHDNEEQPSDDKWKNQISIC